MSWNKTEAKSLFIQRGIHWIVITEGLQTLALWTTGFLQLGIFTDVSIH